MSETTTTLSNNLHTYYHKRLLMSAEKKLVVAKLGFEKEHPKGNGTNSFVLKYGNISESTSTLAEGVTPTAATVDTNKYTVIVNQYGQYIPISDFLIKTAIDPVMSNISDRLGYAAAQSMDTIVQNELIANATNNLKYVGSGNTADNDISAAEIYSGQDILKVIRVLRSNDAPTFEDGKYVWVVHPNISTDLMADTSAGGFIELNKYVSGLADGPVNGEIGRMYGSKIVESSNIQSVDNASTVAVYRSLVLAKDAFCVTKFDKKAIDLIVKEVGSAGSSDPLNQKGTAGYKMEFGVKYIGGSFTNHNGASPDLCVQLRGAANS